MSTFQNQTPSSQKVSNAEKAIHGFLAEKPTLSSHSQKDYQVSVYKQFGHGRYSYELARDLLGFRDAAGSIDKLPHLTARTDVAVRLQMQVPFDVIDGGNQLTVDGVVDGHRVTPEGQTLFQPRNGRIANARTQSSSWHRERPVRTVRASGV
jgi:hypothetical protein